MRRRHKKRTQTVLIAAALLGLLLAGVRPAASQGSVEGELEALLGDMLGSPQARVFIREGTARIPAEAPAPKRRKRPPTQVWDGFTASREKAPLVLPGFRMPRSLRQEALRALRSTGIRRKAAPAVRRVLRVTLVLDPSLTKTQAASAQTAVSEVLGLSQERGDVLKLVRLPVSVRSPLSAADRAGAGESGPAFLAPLTAAGAAAALAASLLLLWLVFRLRGRGRNGAFRRLARLSAAVRGAPEAAAAFLKALKPADAAEVLRALDHDAAAGIFNSVPPDTQRAAACALLAAPRGRRSKGAALAFGDELSSLALSRGLLEAILLRSPDRVRADILRHVAAQAPETAAAIQAALPTVDAVVRARPQALRRCLSVFSSEDLAILTADLPAPARDAVLEALPSILRESVLRLEDSLLPESVERACALRTRLLVRWHRLQRLGRVPALSGSEA